MLAIAAFWICALQEPRPINAVTLAPNQDRCDQDCQRFLDKILRLPLQPVDFDQIPSVAAPPHRPDYACRLDLMVPALARLTFDPIKLQREVVSSLPEFTSYNATGTMLRTAIVASLPLALDATTKEVRFVQGAARLRAMACARDDLARRLAAFGEVPRWGDKFPVATMHVTDSTTDRILRELGTTPAPAQNAGVAHQPTDQTGSLEDPFSWYGAWYRLAYGMVLAEGWPVTDHWQRLPRPLGRGGEVVCQPKVKTLEDWLRPPSCTSGKLVDFDCQDADPDQGAQRLMVSRRVSNNVRAGSRLVDYLNGLRAAAERLTQPLGRASSELTIAARLLHDRTRQGFHQLNGLLQQEESEIVERATVIVQAQEAVARWTQVLHDGNQSLAQAQQALAAANARRDAALLALGTALTRQVAAESTAGTLAVKMNRGEVTRDVLTSWQTNGSELDKSVAAVNEAQADAITAQADGSIFQGEVALQSAKVATMVWERTQAQEALRLLHVLQTSVSAAHDRDLAAMVERVSLLEELWSQLGAVQCGEAHR